MEALMSSHGFVTLPGPARVLVVDDVMSSMVRRTSCFNIPLVLHPVTLHPVLHSGSINVFMPSSPPIFQTRLLKYGFKIEFDDIHSFGRLNRDISTC